MAKVRRVGPALRMLRERAGVSQEELARRAGFDHSKVSRLEKGIQRLTLTDLAVLAGGLGLEVRDVLDAASRRAA